MLWLVCSASSRNGFSNLLQYRNLRLEPQLYFSIFAHAKQDALMQRHPSDPYHRLSTFRKRRGQLPFSPYISAPCTAFVSCSPSHREFSNAKSKTQAATTTTRFNKWRSPVLRQSNTVPPSEKRPPQLFKRTHLRLKNDDALDERLYRADRVLSNRTGKSRKKCFQLLQERRVFIVTDQIYTDPNADSESSSNSTADKIQQYRLEVVTGPAVKLSMHTPLRIDKYQEVPSPPPLLMVYHKPKWVLSVRRDPAGRPCLDDVLLGGSVDTTKPNAVPPLHPVGRLDYDTTGLLLFSSSGPLTQSLLHPKHEIEKEYVAVVTGIVDEDKLRSELAAGVTTGEGVHTARLVSAQPNVPADHDVAAYLANIKAALPSEYNTTDLKSRGYLDVLDATSLSTVTLVVSEGKHRMVRRILANVGHPVVSLHRRRLGDISLGNVPIGQTRPLTPKELKWAQMQLKQGSKPLHPTEKKVHPIADDSEDEELLS